MLQHRLPERLIGSGYDSELQLTLDFETTEVATILDERNVTFERNTSNDESHCRLSIRRTLLGEEVKVLLAAITNVDDLALVRLAIDHISLGKHEQ
jgi:hypothetical protein